MAMLLSSFDIWYVSCYVYCLVAILVSYNCVVSIFFNFQTVITAKLVHLIILKLHSTAHCVAYSNYLSVTCLQALN